MNTKAQPQNLALHAIASSLPAIDGTVPEWITIFPALGKVETRDGRAFNVDAVALTATFKADGIDIPVDINHATDTAAASGLRSDAIGWISELKVEGGALMGKTDWLAEGKAVLSARSYRFTSPSFYHDKGGRTLRLKAVSLVAAPALGNQPALAAAHSSNTPTETTSMKLLAAKLGLTDEASETAMLAALEARLANSVEKPVHDATLASLAAATAELTTIKTEARAATVNDVIESALKAKKILPAEKEHFTALCATDDGLANVKKLIEAKPVMLAASGLDQKKMPDGDGQLTAAQLSAKAKKLVAEGVAGSMAEAMTLVTERNQG